MFSFLPTIFEIIGVVMIAGAVVAYRDVPSRIVKAALPGAGVLAAGFILTHGIPGSVVTVLIAGYLCASVALACILQIAKAAGKVSTIPGGTLAFAFGDGLVLGIWAGVVGTPWMIALGNFASILWGFGLTAWFIGFVARLFAAPMLARRKAEADAAMARMQSDERAANEGEGW